jgi:hypothetical protein
MKKDEQLVSTFALLRHTAGLTQLELSRIVRVKSLNSARQDFCNQPVYALPTDAKNCHHWQIFVQNHLKS